MHAAAAATLEEEGELSAALAAYRRAYALDPSNGQVAVAIANLQRTLREQLEAARPVAPIEALREQARRDTAPPVLNPASDEPLSIEFTNASLRDILDALGAAAGITVNYDEQFQDRTSSVRLTGVTFAQALNQVVTANAAFYKVVSPTTIVVAPDTPQKRAAYEEQVVRTFYVSHANVDDLLELVSAIVQIPQMPVQPQLVASVETNTIIVRSTAALARVVEQIISAQDKPRAEIVVDVEILEVNRDRARQYGLDLSQHAVGAVFSPAGRPSGGGDGGASPADLTAPPFNVNTVTRGVSPADFYAAVPAAIINFLEQDTQTRLVAKPQLRGQEGTQLTLNLGQDIPVPTTAFTPLAAGGAAFNPLTSFEYRPIGVVISMTPRVTFEQEIVLDLEVENSTLGPPILVAGQSLPTFGTRRVTTRLRLRDGESNLLAGLIRREDRRTLRGLPGLLRLPAAAAPVRRYRHRGPGDRHRDAVDAAHRAGAPVHAAGREPAPHRNPAQYRGDRAAAAHSARGGRRRPAERPSAGWRPLTRCRHSTRSARRAPLHPEFRPSPRVGDSRPEARRACGWPGRHRWYKGAPPASWASRVWRSNTSAVTSLWEPCQ